MAEDSADSSLLTSAIEEDSRKVYRQFPTEDRFPCRESPNSNCPPQFETLPRDDDDASKTRGRDQNDALLSDFAEFDDYADSYGGRGVWTWLSHARRRLSKLCSKSEHAPFFPFLSFPLFIFFFFSKRTLRPGERSIERR